MSDPASAFDAWNPGVASEIPTRLMPSVTLYRPGNSTVDYPGARDAAMFCGLKPQDMIAFTARRLIVHELLIRVTADLHVPDGPNYEDLGISLRGMAARILDGHIKPRMTMFDAAFADLRGEVEQRLGALLAQAFDPPVPAPAERGGRLSRLFGTKPVAVVAAQPDEIAAIDTWRLAIRQTQGLDRDCLTGLCTVVSGIVGQRGRLLADRTLVIRLAADMVCNTHGSRMIGQMLDPIIHAAATAEGYRLLPAQSGPVVLNVKGASAAGKSTIRPLQRDLAERLGVPWDEFALVSPDYWRKFLLDYASLGEDAKYAAMLTGSELEIIDTKLDGYMEDKAAQSRMSHLLIDRFRFDSFAAADSQPADSRLLSRFGERVFMFFIITPPAETVERAWRRGLTTGRYKAVDDLLYHNVEAYTGMPHLFFNWVKKKDQNLHFEFLDNAIPLGERPRSLAFGWNDRITILDVGGIRCLHRYRKLNVDARRPEDVLIDEDSSKDDFVRDCIARISEVTFLDQETRRIVGHTRDGVCDFEADGFFETACIEVTRSGDTGDHDAAPVLDLDYERTFTVGAW